MINWQKIWPHLLAYGIMILVSFALFRPYILEDKVLAQPDNQRARGMQTEMIQYEKRDGTLPLWTNSMFSGMPVYMIRHYPWGSLHMPILSASLWWQDITLPHIVILLAMLMAYLALIIMGVDWRIGLLGGISYGISTYYIDLAEAGHSTKMLALAFTPGIWAAAYLILKNKWLLGAGLFALLTSLQIISNHFQITYYTFLVLGIGVLIYGYHAFKNGDIKNWALSLLVMAGALGVSLASNLSMLWPAYEYSKETIRGASELSSKAEKGSGLDKEYAFGWSYGIGESMTLLVPNYMGGGASQTFRETETYRRVYPNIISNLTQQGYSRNEAARSAEQQVSSLFYHGNQPFVGVGIYFGAALIFLFILGFLMQTSPLRWWFFSGGLFALMLSWGNNFFINDLLFDYFPFFNKFRAVSMALGLSHLCVVLLAMLGLQSFLNSKDLAASLKKLYLATGIAGGLVVFAFMSSWFISLTGANDERVGPELANLLQKERGSLIRMDALRSLIIILITAGGLWAYRTQKIKLTVALGTVAILCIADVWLVDTRILFPEKFEPSKVANTPPSPTEADQAIMADPDPHFRVLDLRGNPYTNATTSYFHKSVGGYHAAKLMRYQELIESYLSNPSQNIHLFGMLNTKYIIQNQDGQDRMFPVAEALGNAWFVNQIEIMPDADSEFEALSSLQPRSNAIANSAYWPATWSESYQTDSLSRIALTRYHPDTLVYSYSTPIESFAVFSEIYYPPGKGWEVYLNGERYEDFAKVNYLLRGLKLPAGENQELMMVFHPKSVYSGQNVAFAGSAVALLLLGLGIFAAFKNGTGINPIRLDEQTSLDKSPFKKNKKR